MIIYGKEYHFALTIRAQQRLAEFCPNKDITRLNEVFSGEGFTARDMELAAQFCVILNEGYETKRCFEDLNHKFDPLTMDIVLSLEQDEFEQLQAEAQACYKRDKNPTVGTEPQKKTDAAAPESGSTSAGTSTTGAASA